MKTMRNTVIAIAKATTTYNEFVDKIYSLSSCTMISDLDSNVVDYLDKNGKWHSVDCSKYTAKMN